MSRIWSPRPFPSLELHRGWGVAAVGLMLLSTIFVSLRGVIGMAISIASLVLALVSLKNPLAAFQIILFLLPSIGVLHVFTHDGKFTAISLLLVPFVYGSFGFIGSSEGLSRTMKQGGVWKKWLLFYLIVLGLTSAIAAINYLVMWGQGDSAKLTRQYHGPSTALHAVGWVLFQSLVQLSGPLILFYAMYLGRRLGDVGKLFSKCATPLVWGFTIPLLMGLVQLAGGYHLAHNFNADLRVSGSFGDYNNLAFSLVLGYPFFVSMRNAGWLKKSLHYLFLGGVSFFLLQTGTRSALLAIAIAAFLSFLWVLKRRDFSIKKLFGILFMALVFLLLVGSQTSMFKRTLSAFREGFPGEENRILRIFGDNRLHMWRGAWTLFKEHPISGVGTGAYLTELPKVAKKTKIIDDNAGNFYLQTACETGIFGLLFIVLFFFGVLRQSWGVIRKGNAATWAIFCFGSVVGMLVAFLYGPHTQFFEVQLLFWLTMGLLLAANNSEDNLAVRDT